MKLDVIINTYNDEDNIESFFNNLKEELKNLRPKALRFAKTKSTSKIPYWVVLQNNKLYRLGDNSNPIKGEIELVYSKFTNTIWLKTLNGTEIGEDSESILSYLFKDVNSETYFINIVADSASFSSLLVTKQFLRNKKFSNNWFITEDFKLYRSARVDYRASE